MKHVVALFLSLVLMLGCGVSSRPAAAVGSSEPAACTMSDGVGCAHCACCVNPAGPEESPLSPSLPVPDAGGRSHLAAAPLLSALPILALDVLPLSAPLSSFRPLPSSVPLFRRHCLLLI